MIRVPDMTQHGRLEAAETEVQIAFQLRGVSIRMCQPGGWKGDRAIVSRLCETIENRTAWISEPQQLGHFVVRLAGGIVTRSAEEFVSARLLDQIQAGVATGYDEYDRRK